MHYDSLFGSTQFVLTIVIEDKRMYLWQLKIMSEPIYSSYPIKSAFFLLRFIFP